MNDRTRLIHGLFAGILVLLGLVSAGNLYMNRDRATILPRDTRNPAADSQLPPDHPPVDAANRIAGLEELSRQNPTSADYKTQIGNVYYDMGQYQRAIEAYQASLQLRPKDPSVETDLATCYHYLGQHDKALELLDRVLEHQPDFPQAMFNKGIVLYAGKNDPEGAVAVWDRLLKVHPDLPQRDELVKRIQQLKSAVR